jgi:hypothetical protein
MREACDRRRTRRPDGEGKRLPDRGRRWADADRRRLPGQGSSCLRHARAATSDEIKALRQEARTLKDRKVPSLDWTSADKHALLWSRRGNLGPAATLPRLAGL